MKPTIETNEANFESEVLKAQEPVLVDFWAEWCGPCKMLGPVLDQIAMENAGRVRVAKVNIDESPELASRYKIQSIPTLLYMKNGEVRDQTVGVISKKAILAKLATLNQEAERA